MKNNMDVLNSKSRDELKGFSSELSESIHLLGDILGQVILEQAGKEIFEIVEKLRLLAKKVRYNETEISIQEMFHVVGKLDLDTAVSIIKAFTIYFHLVNEAEKVEIVRVNRKREIESKSKPRKESIAEAIYTLKEGGLNANHIQEILNKMSIEPVFTAHPTEAKRPALLRKLKRISTLLEQHQTFSELTELEDKKLREELKSLISILWNTPEVRTRKPSVLEEAHNTLHHLRETVFSLIPEVYDDLKRALNHYYPSCDFKIPYFIKYGSWVGGDRDGNPFVTSIVTLDVLKLNSINLLNKYVEIIKELRHEMTVASASKELIESINEDFKFIKPPGNDMDFYPYEPYRKKFWFIQKKLEGSINFVKTGLNEKNRYKTHFDFLSDLKIVVRSLRENNLNIISDSGILADLLVQVETFGFHLVELDVREHSDKHEKAIAEIIDKAQIITENYSNLKESDKQEILTKLILDKKFSVPDFNFTDETKNVLDVFKAIKSAHLSIGKESVRCYITSFTQSVSDILEVLFFAKICGLINIDLKDFSVSGDLDIVPLFETVTDLENSSKILSDLFENRLYKEYLKSRNKFQEIMLGFSDSGKDGGYLAANIELYYAQKEMSEVCKKYDISWRFFHGRGGSIGRGGAQTGKAIQSEPIGSVNGKIRFTEQGEVIAFRYSIPKLAHRHIEAVVHAVLITTSNLNKNNHSVNKKEEDVLFRELIEFSKKKYRSLVYEEPGFWKFFTKTTPYNFISLLNIASRPTSRTDKQKIEDIRAITWGFSLTQVRLMLNSWFGIGTGIYEMSDKRGIVAIQNLYNQNSFFKVTLDSCQQALLKADMHTASLYKCLMEEEASERNRIFDLIVKEYNLSKEMILKVTGQKDILDNKPVIKKSIKLRNPYTDPLNCIQVELLKRAENNPQDIDKKMLAATLHSINGIAAAMQETG